MKYHLTFLMALYMILYTYRINNDVYESFYPDERQYTTCSGLSGKGETNISMKEIKPTPPLTGFFSAILGITEEKSNDKHFEIHTCVPSESLSLDSLYETTIIDNDEEEDSSGGRFMEYHNAKPFDEFAVVYPEKFHKQFLEKRERIIEGDDRF